MTDFDDLWKFANRHGDIVQNRKELEYIFNLIQDCESYLEIGTAEGNSLYVLSHALKSPAKITYIDIGEDHTLERRTEYLVAIKHHKIHDIIGNSHSIQSIARANMYGDYDVVLIDAGHTYEDVILDEVMYGRMAKKFLLFHDIQLPEVEQAFDWYRKVMEINTYHKFVRSEIYGYGIITL